MAPIPMAEIKEMIVLYQNNLAECNQVWEEEGNSERYDLLAGKVHKSFTAVCDAVNEHVQTLVQDLSDIDVYLMSIDTVTGYSSGPYHSYYARVKCPSTTFMAGSVSKHMRIKGFPYRN